MNPRVPAGPQRVLSARSGGRGGLGWALTATWAEVWKRAPQPLELSQLALGSGELTVRMLDRECPSPQRALDPGSAGPGARLCPQMKAVPLFAVRRDTLGFPPCPHLLPLPHPQPQRFSGPATFQKEGSAVQASWQLSRLSPS